MSKIGPSKDAFPCSNLHSDRPPGSPSLNVSSGGKNGFANGRSQESQKGKQMYREKQPVRSNHNIAPKFDEEHFSRGHRDEPGLLSCEDRGIQIPPLLSDSDFPPLSNAKNPSRKKVRNDLGLDWRKEDNTSPELKGLNTANAASLSEEISLTKKFGKKVEYRENSYSDQVKSGRSAGTKDSDCSEDSVKVERFFICNRKVRSFGGRNVSIQGNNLLSSIEMDQSIEGTEHRVLRPGMVLLKHFITLPDQIKIVKSCHNHGKRPGGFYRPGYNDGAKLRLHMMCLGRNWDPQTRKYNDEHPVDHCKPPIIPQNFSLLVRKAMQEAHSLIGKDLHQGSVEGILPTMSPDICIVNFYTNSGRLGLHQDRDESRESINKGLPVVSFSLGDTAEFLFGDERDVQKAESVFLESGDVLIFGGESRLVYHGVPSIVPNSAPERLLAETGLRPGRLNLTFRQY